MKSVLLWLIAGVSVILVYVYYDSLTAVFGGIFFLGMLVFGIGALYESATNKERALDGPSFFGILGTVILLSAIVLKMLFEHYRY
jgi:4-hydroxybenzoate polyprenyltransferase